MDTIAITVAQTLRYAASLAHACGHPGLASMLYETATNTESEDLADSWCCPVCEEATCDESCPLADVRKAAGR